MGHFSNPRHFLASRISVINYITGILGRGCCIMKERNILLSQLLKSSTASDIRGGHCAADKPGFLSLWTVIPYCSKGAGRGEQRQTLVHWHDAHPAFYSQEISLESERGDKMFRHRVTECQTARNSQLMLLAPSRVTMGTQSWPSGSLTTRCGWIIQSWCRASGRLRLAEQRAVHWWYRWEQSAEAPGDLHMLTTGGA